MRFYIALWLGKLINWLIGRIDPSRGSNLAGQKAMKVDPFMLMHFKGIDQEKVLFITGTNGKSTTNNLINHIFRENGKTVVSNLEGANLSFGVATALIRESTLLGRLHADFYIFETDERYMPLIRKQIPAANLMITNLQKDQVQRNGDPDFIYRKVRKAFGGEPTRLFLNNEEPRAMSFAEFGDQVITFGVERHSEAFMKNESYVTMPCPRCHHKISFEYYNTDGIGRFHCDNCGLASIDHADYEVRQVDFAGRCFEACGERFPMPYDTPYMLYNYAAAIAVARELGGIQPADAARAFNTFRNVGGRFEVMHYKGKTIKYMRIKQENPETLQTSINVMAADPGRKMIALGLCPLVDIIPHYANSFYAFDCDLSGLVKSDVEKYFCFSERVCYDTANRLIYEGVDPWLITIADTENIHMIFREIEEAETDNIYLITWLHTYEDMEKFLKEEGAVYE